MTPRTCNRYLIRRLDHTHCEELRLSDLRIRQIPPWKTRGFGAKPTASRDNLEAGGLPSTAANAATVVGGTGYPGAISGEHFDPRPRSSDGAGSDRSVREGCRANASAIAQAKERHPSSQYRTGVLSAHTTHGDITDISKHGRGDSSGGGGGGGGGGDGDGGGGGGGDDGGGDGGGGDVWVGVGGGGVGVGSGGGCVRFDSGQGTVPRLPSTLVRQSWPSSPVTYFSSAGSSFPLSRASTTSSGRRSKSWKGERGGLLAVAREAKEAGQAEARQALARTEPNLFPEIFAASPGEASGENLRGRRGWLAEA